MSNHRTDIEDPEALFPSYYVQSPCTTISHANSADIVHNTSREFPILFPNSPIPSSNPNATNPGHSSADAALIASRFTTLSRYSSSRGSNNSNSFLNIEKISTNNKIVAFDDLQSHETATENGEKRLIIIDGCINEDVDDEGGDHGYYYDGSRSLEWWRYLSFSYSSSTAWILLQVSWRFIVSLGVALLVFYLATKPPSPKMSIKVARISEFGLGEGVDSTGVSTKILNCNISLHLLIDNPSKIYPLHIQRPHLELSFGRLPLASSSDSDHEEEEELRAESNGKTLVELEVGTRNKPMYGAGRAMEDMVESGQGLTLSVRTRLRSSYHIVGSLVVPKFHHQVLCSLVLLRGGGAGGSGGDADGATTYYYDRRHRTLVYNSTCLFLPS